ncbi:hypothetical protein J5Y03_05305 [Bacillus sp. RG28]|uniref:Uncharacterized protein n=1 Tax=Gottfriedia endophytica TaxID=2820819 RepID=A0A940NTJ5_9BACI|nr:hypothetical protein [Gottfriedia endophytica]MBP0724603.1 hypothetical protein [Gottfriedia endophytica]
MRKIELVHEVVLEESRLNLKIKSNDVDLSQAVEIGTLIADSDNASLLYIIEEKEDFVYISIPSSLWNEINNAYIKELPVYLTCEKGEMLLENWQFELSTFLENVEGNFNYGQEFVEKVNDVFLKR